MPMNSVVTVKIKGREVFANDVKVATIRGWRNPAGRDHVPYVIECESGKNIGRFSYAKDAHQYARTHIQRLMEKTDMSERRISGNIVFQPERGEADGGRYFVENPGTNQATGISTRNLSPADLRAMADHLEAQRSSGATRSN